MYIYLDTQLPTTMSVDPLQENLVSDFQLVRAGNYGIVASFAFLAYDVVLTLGHEITYIWRERWSYPKFAYFCVRYYGLFYLAMITIFSLRENNSYDTCRRYYAWLTFGGPMIFTTLSNSILMLRVHALHNRKRHLMVFFVCLLICQFATELYTTIRIHSTIADINIPRSLSLHWPGCPVSGYHADYTLIAWVPNIFTTTIFFFLTLWNFIKSAPEYCQIISLRRSRRAWHVPPLLCAFVEDGTIHFFMLVAALTIVLVLAVRVQGPLGLLSSPWMIAIYSVSTSRLILHLRVFAAHQRGSTPTWHQTFSIRIHLTTADDDSTGNNAPQAEQNHIGRQMELRVLSPQRDLDV